MFQIIILILFIVEFLLMCCTSISEHTKNSILLPPENFWIDTTDESYSATSAEAIAATAAAISSENLRCPSVNVIRIKYKCPTTSNSWRDCVKSHCCPGYSLINGKCISVSDNPCDLSLCEQKCTFIFQRVVCTCWDGYRFTVNDQKYNNKSMCIDIDECKEGIHDCEQICRNIPGSFECDCQSGFTLRNDNKTCSGTVDKLNDQENMRCIANCNTVEHLQNQIYELQEKLTILETVMNLSMQNGPQLLPLGQSESHHVSEKDDSYRASAAYSDEFSDDTSRSHSILDSFIQTDSGYCKCQRGPIGPPGPTGSTGPKGAPGDRGSKGAKGIPANLDFFLLILADIRHDITLLQERVFPGETLSKFDFETVLKKERSIGDTKKEENVHSEEAKNFQGSKSPRVSDYTPEEGLVVESSGDEWDHYEE